MNLDTRRIFAAHPIALSDEALVALKAEIVEACKGAFSHDVEVILGRDSFRDDFATHGGWAGWVRWVGEGTVATFGGIQPTFHAYVVGPGPTVGKATAEFLQRALRAGRPVFVLSERQLWPARSVTLYDREDMRGGWVVESDAPIKGPSSGEPADAAQVTSGPVLKF